MCEECRRTPCHPQCPNADEPQVVYECVHCHYGIVEAESYYNVDGEPWCEDCIRDCYTSAEVIE